MSVVYLIESPCGRVYVGATTGNLLKRISEHRYVSKQANRFSGRSPLYKAIRKYGLEYFNFSVLVECEKEDLDYFESCFVDLFDSHANGLNAKFGGKSGGKLYVSKNIIKSAKIQIQKIFNDPKLLAKARANSLTPEKQRARSLIANGNKVAKCPKYEIFDTKTNKSLGIFQGYTEPGKLIGCKSNAMNSYVKRGKHKHYTFKFVGGAA